MGLVVVLSCAALILLVVFVVRKHQVGQNKTVSGESIPIVQPCIPFFGNALHLDTANFHLVLSELRQKYGPVYFIKLFRERILVLSDYASIHDALVVKGSDFAGRPLMYRTSQADRNKHSIVWQTYTQRLMLLRKSVLKCLKMYGKGLGKLEEQCAPDILNMCRRFQEAQGKAFDPRSSIYNSVCSIMLCLTVGSRFDHGSPVYQSVKELNEMFNDIFGSGRGKRLDFVPLLWLFRSDNYCRMQKALHLRDVFWEEQLLRMKTSKVDPGCVIKTLLDQIEKSTSSSTVDTVDNQQWRNDSELSVTTAKEVFTNLILAGEIEEPLVPSIPSRLSLKQQQQRWPPLYYKKQQQQALPGTDTTATALSCFLLVLLHHPNIQQRLQEEVDTVVGRGCKPSLSDRPQMPYTEAVLMELLRYISHVPLAVPHSTTCDTTVLGHPVPANTTVYINLWSLHHDETEWTDPWKFDPSRFLDERGQLLSPVHENRRRLLPFGAGRRVCLGEILGKNRLFLFATSLVQRFTFEPEDKDNLPEVDPRTYEMGLTVHPKPFRICAILRNPSESV